jgi:hypothetical protein
MNVLLSRDRCWKATAHNPMTNRTHRREKTEAKAGTKQLTHHRDVLPQRLSTKASALLPTNEAGQKKVRGLGCIHNEGTKTSLRRCASCSVGFANVFHGCYISQRRGGTAGEGSLHGRGTASSCAVEVSSRSQSEGRTRGGSSTRSNIAKFCTERQKHYRSPT